MATTVQKLIEENSEVLHLLNSAGVKNIQTALDYLAVSQLDKTMNYISSKTDRKNKIADQLFMSRRSVENALAIMRKEIKHKKSAS